MVYGRVSWNVALNVRSVWTHEVDTDGVEGYAHNTISIVHNVHLLWVSLLSKDGRQMPYAYLFMHLIGHVSAFLGRGRDDVHISVDDNI